jgi:hypothetical protein
MVRMVARTAARTQFVSDFFLKKKGTAVENEVFMLKAFFAEKVAETSDLGFRSRIQPYAESTSEVQTLASVNKICSEEYT